MVVKENEKHKNFSLLGGGEQKLFADASLFLQFLHIDLYVLYIVFPVSFLFVVLILCCFGVEGLNVYFIVFILEEEVSPGHQAGWMKH